MVQSCTAVQWLKAASRFFSFFFFRTFFLIFFLFKKTNRCLSCLRSKAKKKWQPHWEWMWYFFLWIWLFSKCNPAIFVTLHWKHCFHLCMDDVYFLFRFPGPARKIYRPNQLFTNSINQPADLQTATSPMTPWVSNLHYYLKKVAFRIRTLACHNIHSDWTHTDFSLFRI